MSDRSPDPLAAWIVAGALTFGVVVFSAMPHRAEPGVPAEFDVSIPGAEVYRPGRAERLTDVAAGRDAIDTADDDAGQIAEAPPPAAGAAEIGHKAVKAPSC